MIRRIGFRRLLPMLFTLTHLALVLHASAHLHPTPSSARGNSAYHPVVYQEGPVPWELIEPKPLLPAEKLAILLNLPAFFMAIPVTILFFHGNDLGLLYASVPFVPIVWYGTGRWLDRLLGYFPQPHRIRQGWRGIFALLSSGLFCLSIASITPLNHHRRGDTYWIGSALILWSGLFLAISITPATKRRND